LLPRPDLGDHPVVVLFSIVNRVVDDVIHAGLDAAGFPDIRRHHGVVFEMLDPGGTRVVDIARRARITKQAVGEMVADLERRGYVARRPDPSDGRAKLVVLTERGQRAMDAAVAAVRELETAWLAELGEERFGALRGTLERVCLRFGREHIR
jgi:DNA-binding MarR family transcriptional regulator